MCITVDIRYMNVHRLFSLSPGLTIVKPRANTLDLHSGTCFRLNILDKGSLQHARDAQRGYNRIVPIDSLVAQQLWRGH